MIPKTFLYGLMLCLALGFSLPAHADDETLVGPDGTVYRTSPAQQGPQAAVAAPTGKTHYHDRSGVRIDLQSIARSAKQYHQPVNHANQSSAYR